MGWNEWLIIIAVLLLALKLMYDEIMYRLHGRPRTFGLSNADSQEVPSQHRAGDSAGGDPTPNQTMSLPSSKLSQRKESTDNDAPNVHITNIEIHDSIINRSTFLSPEDDMDTDNNDGIIANEINTTGIIGSVVHRSSIQPSTIDEPDDQD